MFDIRTRADDRGLAGIGAIIMFIALVLVAAVAASLYVDFSGSLQSQAQSTGEESKAQVANQIQIVDVVGEVNTNGTGVDEINMNVRRSAGAGDIDLKMATIRIVSQDGSAVMIYNSTTATAGSTFTVTEYRDSDSSLPILASQDDRANITMMFDGTGAGDRLDRGEEVTVQITDSAGGTFTTSFDIPSSLNGKEGETLLLR